MGPVGQGKYCPNQTFVNPCTLQFRTLEVLLNQVETHLCPKAHYCSSPLTLGTPHEGGQSCHLPDIAPLQQSWPTCEPVLSYAVGFFHLPLLLLFCLSL